MSVWGLMSQMKSLWHTHTRRKYTCIIDEPNVIYIKESKLDFESQIREKQREFTAEEVTVCILFEEKVSFS